MIERLKFNKILMALFILCIIVRYIFIFGVDQIHVMWDARIYSSAALGLIYYTDHSDDFGHLELPARADTLFYRGQFTSCMKEHIEGERIDWLYYSIPTMPEAQNYLFISGPIYPIFLVGIFLAAPDEDFTAVRIINVLIDGLCMILVMLIANMLIDRRVAIVAGFIYILYLPFILLTGLISPDSITLLLTLYTLYCLLKWYNCSKSIYIYMAGLTLGLLVLTRATATLLAVPFLIGLIFDFRKNFKDIIFPVLRAAIPYILAVLPWIIIASVYFGQPTIRDPQYAEANIRSSLSIKFEGYDLDYIEDDFWTAPLIEDVGADLSGYGGLVMKKILRLWSQPFNDYSQSFIFGKTSAKIFHVLIILPALFGVFFFLGEKRRGLIFLFLIPAYYTLIHMIFHSLARYNLNAMPFMIIAASAVLIKIYDYIKSRQAAYELKPIMFKLLRIILGGLFVWLFPEKIGAGYLGARFGVMMIVAIKLIILSLILYFLFVMIKEKAGRQRAIRVCMIPSALLLLVLIFSKSNVQEWAEWKTTLRAPRQIAGNMIFIPQDFLLQEGEFARIGIDMVTKRDMINPVNIIINGQLLPLHIDESPIDDFYYNKATYKVYEALLDIGKEEMRAWRFIPLRREVFNKFLSQFGVIDIAVSVGDSTFEHEAFIDLFGNYKVAKKGEVLIPSLTHSSIERFVEKDDPRIWLNYPLSSDSVIPYYTDDIATGRVNRSDLSPDGGNQYGRFRIYLEIKRLDNSRYYF